MEKKKLKFIMDSPFVLIFALICVAVFLFDTFVFKGKAVSTVFSCPSAKGFDTFQFANPICYLRLIFHVLGNCDTTIFLANLMALIFLGPQLELRFGAPIFILMITLAALVSGVLNACLGTTTVCGLESVIFLLIFLFASESLLKKNLELSKIFCLLVYVGFVLYSSFKKEDSFLPSLIYMLTSLAGGFMGALIGFFVAPRKSKANQSVEKKDRSNKSTDVTEEFIKPKKSVKENTVKEKKKRKPAELEDKAITETIIGTIS